MKTKDFIKEIEETFENDEQTLEIAAYKCIYGGEVEELGDGLKAFLTFVEGHQDDVIYAVVVRKEKTN